MTADEATKQLNEWYPHCSLALYPNFPKAVKLGAEALARLSRERKHGRANVWLPLPSEDPLPAPTLSPDEIKRIRESPLAKRPGD